MSRRSALQQAMARIRLGRAMTTSQMARKLGLTPSQLFWIEAGQKGELKIPADVAEELEQKGFASRANGAAVAYTPVPLPKEFEARVVETFELNALEQRILAEGIAGRCDPPFPTDEELREIRRQLRLVAGVAEASDA